MYFYPPIASTQCIVITPIHTPYTAQSREVRKAQDSLSAESRQICLRLTVQHRMEKVSISGLLKKGLISEAEAESHKKEADEAFDEYR